MSLHSRRINQDVNGAVYRDIVNLWESVNPCLLSVCFDDAMHGRYASYFVNMRFLHHQNKPTKGMGWRSPPECRLLWKEWMAPVTNGQVIIFFHPDTYVFLVRPSHAMWILSSVLMCRLVLIIPGIFQPQPYRIITILLWDSRTSDNTTNYLIALHLKFE